MDKRSEYLPKTYKWLISIQKKRLYIINHEENANLNHNKIPPSHPLDGYNEKGSQKGQVPGWLSVGRACDSLDLRVMSLSPTLSIEITKKKEKKLKKKKKQGAQNKR